MREKSKKPSLLRKVQLPSEFNSGPLTPIIDESPRNSVNLENIKFTIEPPKIQAPIERTVEPSKIYDKSETEVKTNFIFKEFVNRRIFHSATRLSEIAQIAYRQTIQIKR